MAAIPRSILVIGAGELGVPILKSLCSHPTRNDTQISVLLRPSTIGSTEANKQAEVDALKALGIRLIPGDVVNDSHTALVSLFQQHEAVIGATGMSFVAGTQTRISRAVLEAQVKLYIPWQFGLDYDTIGSGSAQDLFTEQLDIRNVLRAQSSTQWLIISTGIFMSFMFEPAFEVVNMEKGVVHALGSWENAVTVTTVEDIGKVTAAAVFDAPQPRNQVIFSASETVTYGKLADVAEAVRGEKAERVLWDSKTLKQDLKGEPDNGLKKYRVVLAEGKGVSWRESDTFTAQRGVEMTDVTTWVERRFNRATDNRS